MARPSILAGNCNTLVSSVPTSVVGCSSCGVTTLPVTGYTNTLPTGYTNTLPTGYTNTLPTGYTNTLPTYATTLPTGCTSCASNVMSTVNPVTTATSSIVTSGNNCLGSFTAIPNTTIVGSCTPLTTSLTTAGTTVTGTLPACTASVMGASGAIACRSPTLVGSSYTVAPSTTTGTSGVTTCSLNSTGGTTCTTTGTSNGTVTTLPTTSNNGTTYTIVPTTNSNGTVTYTAVPSNTTTGSTYTTVPVTNSDGTVTYTVVPVNSTSNNSTTYSSTSNGVTYTTVPTNNGTITTLPVTGCTSCSSSTVVSATPTLTPIVVIGDTAEAVLYVNRLIRNRVANPIVLLMEGRDMVTQNESIANVGNIYTLTCASGRITSAEPIRYVSSANLDPCDLIENDRCTTVTQNIGTGLVGNLLIQPIMDVGPWIPSTASSAAVDFVNARTTDVPYSTLESRVVHSLSSLFQLQITPVLVTKRVSTSPTLTLTHRYLLGDEENSSMRELFLDDITAIQRPNVTMETNVSSILFTNSTAGCGITYRTGCTQNTISGARIVFKTHPVTFTRIAGEGGLFGCSSVPTTRIPTEYRAVVGIGTQYVGSATTCDGVTSRISFSLYDLASNASNTVTWMIHTYTTTEDVVTGLYGDVNAGTALLVVEALNVRYKRVLSYNNDYGEVQVSLGADTTEAHWMAQFNSIVSTIHLAYTGLQVSLTPTVDICVGGTCVSSNRITSMVTQPTIPFTVYNLVNSLYPSNTVACA